MQFVLAGCFIGVAATVLLDLWNVALNRLAGVPQPNWGMVGRWVATLPQGRVFHDAIADVPSVRGELAIGWVFHYAVGAIYGAAFILIIGASWLASPTLLPAWIFGIVTLGFGWFLLQPGLGAGVAGSRTPNPLKTRILGLLAHTVFGIGLWAAALPL